MEMPTIDRNVRMSGMGTAVPFSVNKKNFGFISSILSDKLYSNKVLAVIREYISNGIDSTIRSGTSRNLLITPPSVLSPVFKVRDFGKGLSEEFVNERFISFGDSDKREKVDEIGAYGIGCKSGFAYTDSFNITSWFEGIRYSFTAQKAANGELELYPLGQTASSEPSGIEISIPVQDHDIQRFNAELAEFCKYLTIPVDFNGAFTVPALDKVCDFGTFFVERTDRYSQRGCKVLMGGVTYPIDNAQLKDDFRYAKNIVIRAQIGEVDVAPDREKLEYTKKVADFLAESFANIKDQVAADFQKKVDALAYPWEAVKLLKESNDSLGSLIHQNLKDLSFKGRKFEDNKEGVKYYNAVNGKWYSHCAYLTCHNISEKTVLVVAPTDSRIIPSRLSAGITEKLGFTPNMIIVSDSQEVFSKLFCDFWDSKQIVRDYKALWSKVAKTGPRLATDPNIWVYANKSHHRYERAKNVLDGKFYVPFVGRNKISTVEDEKLCALARNLEIQFYGINRVHVKKLDSSWKHLKVAVEAAVQKSLKDFDAKKYYVSKAFRDIGLQSDIRNMIFIWKETFGAEDNKAVEIFYDLAKYASEDYVNESDALIAYMKENGVEVKIGEHKDMDAKINTLKSFVEKYLLVIEIYSNCGWRSDSLKASIKKYIQERTN